MRITDKSFISLAEKRLSGQKLLSLDIFDTAILRKTAHPTDVFRWVEQDRRWLSVGLEGRGFHDLRIKAEQKARERVWHDRQAVEVTLQEIYEEVARLNPEWQGAISHIMQWEMDWEMQLTVTSPQIHNLYTFWLNSGGAVAFTTDIYHQATFIQSLLNKNGYDRWDHLFVSSELGVSKADGRLFDHLLEVVNLNPCKVLHIGDNHGSDIEKARRRGIGALHFPKRMDHCVKKSFFPGIVAGSNTDRGISLYRGLVANLEPTAKDPAGRFQESLGYRVLGPILTSFTTWLIDASRKHGVERLCFLARDGKIMRRAFATLHEVTGQSAIEHHYLYASRRAINVAGIHQLSERDIDFLCSGNTRLPVRAFLERVGLDAKGAEVKIRDVGFSNPDQVVQPNQYGQLRQLFERLASEIESIAAVERKAFTGYLRSIHAMEDEQVLGLVDIGWHGSMQTSLHRLLDSEGCPEKLCGFYFGLHPGAVKNQFEESSLHGFFTHNGEPWERYITLRHCIEVIEYFFSSTDPSCIRVRCNGEGLYEPVFDKYQLSETDAKILQTLQDSAIRFLEDYASACDGQILPLPLEQPASDLSRLLRNPTRREALELGRLSFSDGFGNYQKFRMLGSKGPWLRNLLQPARFKEDFKSSFWRAGYYAQLSAVERKWLKLIAPVAVTNISPND